MSAVMMAQVWLRDAGDDEDECWVPCAKGDDGATLFIPAAYMVTANRQIQDYEILCRKLVEERNKSSSLPRKDGQAASPHSGASE